MEGQAACSRTRRIRPRPSEELLFHTAPPPSPRSVADTWRWASRYRKALPSQLQSVLTDAVSNKPLVMSTAYSGVGMWEVAAYFIGHACGGSSLRVYEAAEVEASAQHVLLSHTGSSQASRVFGNIAKRWPSASVDLVQHHASLAQQAVQQAAPESAQEVYDSCAAQFERMGTEILQKVDMVDSAYCYRHSRYCPLRDVDAAAVRQAGGVLLHAASPVCKDHSLQNRFRLGTVGVHSIAWTCWIQERVKNAHAKLEDFVLMEITPQHPSLDLLQRALPAHTVFSWVVSPDDFGLPSTRARKYSVAVAPWMRPVTLPRCLFKPRCKPGFVGPKARNGSVHKFVFQRRGEVRGGLSIGCWGSAQAGLCRAKSKKWFCTQTCFPKP